MPNKSQQFELLDPPAELMDRVMNSIAEERRLIPIKQRIFLFSVGLLATVVGFIPAFKMLKSAFTESGFLQFFSLIFSDAQIVLANWGNYVSTLLETLPVMSLVLFLALIFFALEFLKLLSRDIHTMLSKINNNLNLNLWT